MRFLIILFLSFTINNLYAGIGSGPAIHDRNVIPLPRPTTELKSDATQKSLKKLGYDFNEVIDILQKNLVSGNITLPEGLSKESFADS